MTCPSTSSPRNSSYSSVCHLKLIASNPLTTSILGTLLFIDKRGIFRPILNAFDPISCRKAGIKPLRLTHDLKDYIKTTPSNEVLVQISPGGTVQNCAYDDFVQYIPTRFKLIVVYWVQIQDATNWFQQPVSRSKGSSFILIQTQLQPQL